MRLRFIGLHRLTPVGIRKMYNKSMDKIIPCSPRSFDSLIYHKSSPHDKTHDHSEPVQSVSSYVLLHSLGVELNHHTGTHHRYLEW